MSFRQKGNPVLDYIKNVRWQVRVALPSRRCNVRCRQFCAHPCDTMTPRRLPQFADIVPDYILGSKGTVALYISLRYHLLNPTYLLGRLKELQNA